MKKMKPMKAWAVCKWTKIVFDWGQVCIYASEKRANNNCHSDSGEVVIPVLITPITKRK